MPSQATKLVIKKWQINLDGVLCVSVPVISFWWAWKIREPRQKSSRAQKQPRERKTLVRTTRETCDENRVLIQHFHKHSVSATPQKGHWVSKYQLFTVEADFVAVKHDCGNPFVSTSHWELRRDWKIIEQEENDQSALATTQSHQC